MLKISLFGAPQFQYQDAPIDISRRKSIALFAYLALATRPQSRETLATLLWPELDEEHARGALRSAIYSLTTRYPQLLEEGNRSVLMLNSSTVWVDVREFRSLLAERRTHEHEPDQICDKCIQTMEVIDRLYHADFLEGFSLADSAEFDDWQLIQREQLRREYSTMLRRTAQYYLDLGQYENALGYARRWLALSPLHEPAHRLLMRLYAADGQRAEAIRQYEECVVLLDEQLATPPEEETVQLYESIRANTGQNEQIVPLIPTTSNILPPLPALMIGREDVLRDLKSRLSNGHLITVIQGWPGIGKSTIVSALAHESEIFTMFPDGVLWTSLGETPNLFGELLIWAKTLKIVDESQTPSLERLVAQLHSALRDKRALLIVDDVWHVEHGSLFRLGGQNCALVMTSRLNDVAEALAPTAGDVYRLKVLAEENALQLLAKLAPQVVAEHPAESRALVRSLEGLPLAIQVAGRLLNNEARLGWGITKLLDELRDGAALLMAQAPSDMVGIWHDTTPTVAALLKRSTDALDELIRQRFADLAMFVPKPATFDLQAMAALWDIDDPKATARILVNRGLLEPLSGGRFQMHALLILHARGLMDLAK